MKNVQCPHCHKKVVWSEASLYRPFCSKRCRLIDLGAWAEGSYAIPAISTPTAANAAEGFEEEQDIQGSHSPNDDNA